MSGFLEQLQEDVAFRQRFVRFPQTATQWEQDKAAYALKQSKRNITPLNHGTFPTPTGFLSQNLTSLP